MAKNQHLQELAAYRFTVENLQARVAELEAKLAAAQQAMQDGVPVGWINADTLRAMQDTPKSEKTRWPIYNLSEYASKEGMVPVYSTTHTTQQGMDARQWLQQRDFEALERFEETSKDDESYDIGKEAIQRLTHFGCLNSHGFGRYSITAFGSYVIDNGSLARELPFKMQSERDAGHRAALASTQPAAQGMEAEYQRGYQDGYNRRDAEVKGALV